MRRVIAVFGALALLAGLSILQPLTAAADPVYNGATWTETYFPSKDGTMLHADVFLPAGRRVNDQHPVILSIGPYFGTGANGGPAEAGPIDRFGDMVNGGQIFERGYAYVQVDSRGYGGSDGCYNYGGNGEQMDATAAVEWASHQSWSNGNVGMWGKSYDGWTQVMALANKPEGLKAAVVQAPIDDGYKIAFMNGIHYALGWYITPGLYAQYDVTPQSANNSSPDEFIYPTKGTLTNPTCPAENIVITDTMYDRSFSYWQEREISGRARHAEVPILWSHGFNDANTKPDNFLDTWEGYRGEQRGWFGQWDHVRGNESNLVGRDGFLDEAMAFFDEHLKGLPPVDYPNVEIQDGEGQWRTEDQWPPADADYDLGSIPIKPGSYTDDGSNSAGGSGGGKGTWTFTEPAPYDLRWAGTSVLDLNVSTAVPNANLVALIYDVDEGGQASLITRGAYLLEEGGRVTFETYPQDWVLRQGHRIGILLSSNDSSWFNPIPTRSSVTVNSGVLELPFLRYLRTSNLEGGPARAQGGNPRLILTTPTITGNEVDASFPPVMIPRP